MRPRVRGGEEGATRTDNNRDDKSELRLREEMRFNVENDREELTREG